MKTNPKTNIIHKNNSLSMWIGTQNFLNPYLNGCDIRGLDYIGNSCYQDSVLLSTFAISNKIITRYILDRNVKEISKSKKQWITCGETPKIDYYRRKAIQNEIIKITKSMRRIDIPVKYCSNLRKIIQKCPGTEEFNKTTMQDAGEFLQYLFNIFQVDVAKTTETTYVTNDNTNNPNWKLIGTTTDNKASPIVSVSEKYIEDAQVKQINEFLIQVDTAKFSKENLYKHKGTKYSRRKMIWKMNSSPYIVFYIHRLQKRYNMMTNSTSEFKLCTKIIPVYKINKLFLSAIIIHYNNHYTVYFNYKKVWFYYDDGPQKRSYSIKEIGTYDDMIISNPDPSRYGTLFYYT